MKTEFKSIIRAGCHSFGVVCAVAVVLQFGVLAGSAQTGIYLYTGSETTITLNPGIYDITAYGAQGGAGYGGGGGLGAEIGGQFYFAEVETLTILVGGGGGSGADIIAYGGGGGGGGGTFIVNNSTPLVIAGGGGGGGPLNLGDGGSGGTGASGGGGGGSGGGGGFGFGGGGGSIIDSSAIMVLAEISGVASPDDSPNGEIIITAVPEPNTLALAAMSGLSLLLFRRQRK